MSQALIVPVRADAARAWAAGALNDVQLFEAFDPTRPEAMLLCSLEDRAAWRSGILQARYWWKRGARLAVSRTGNPAVLHRFARAGLVKTVLEANGWQWRLIGEPTGFL